MFMNLSFMSLSMLDIFGIDVVIIISLILRVSFIKINTDSEVVISITLLFSKNVSFSEEISLSFMNRTILLSYR